jgi:hypothetical protein
VVVLTALLTLLLAAVVVAVVSAPLRRARAGADVPGEQAPAGEQAPGEQAPGEQAPGERPAMGDLEGGGGHAPGGAHAPDDAHAPGGAHTLDELQAAREAKYREIRDAELDYRTGKLSREDYEAIDADLRAEAIEILDGLRRLKPMDA